MKFRAAVHIPLLLAAIGAVFFGVGFWLLTTDGPRREAQRAAALPVVDATSLAVRSLDETVLIEGVIAPDTPAGFRDFVAWHRAQYDGVEDSGPSKGQERWKHVETVAPPFSLVAAGGAVPVVNRGYALRDTPHAWSESTSRSPGLFEKRAERAAGFRAGDRVVVEAQVVAEPGAEGALATRALRAVVLSGGDRAAYLASLQSAILAAKIVGGVFTGVGALVLVFAAWLFSRRHRAARPTEPPRRRR